MKLLATLKLAWIFTLANNSFLYLTAFGPRHCEEFAKNLFGDCTIKVHQEGTEKCLMTLLQPQEEIQKQGRSKNLGKVQKYFITKIVPYQFTKLASTNTVRLDSTRKAATFK